MSTLPSECRSFLRVVESFIDGELPSAALVEGERHVAGCSHCRERVELGRAMKGSVRALSATPLGAEAKNRLRASLEAELQRSPSTRAEFPRARVAAASVFVAGLAAAAWLLAPRLPSRNAATPNARGDDVLAELVSEHVHPLPLDGTDPQTVRSLEQYVGIPIRPHFPTSRAKLVGARILPFQNERAAIVRYELAPPAPPPGAPATGAPPARQVSVLVFDPRRIHLNPHVGTLAEPVDGRAVHMTRTHGLPVAFVEEDGIGYALSGDVDEAQAVELVRYVAAP